MRKTNSRNDTFALNQSQMNSRYEGEGEGEGEGEAAFSAPSAGFAEMEFP